MGEGVVKFAILKGSAVVEDVYVGNIGPLRFLVTTDSPKTILDRSLADELGLRLVGPLAGIGAGGEVPS